MEHPVPQNVTSFEFHLVGDMTLRQFAYLAIGCSIAYIIFVAFFAAHPLFSTPMIAFFALTGAAFAFLPIADRPLDHWVKAFFLAVNSPTQGAWNLSSKTPVPPSDPVFKNRLQLYLSSLNVSAPSPAPVLSKGWGVPIAPVVAVAQSTPAIPSATELNKLVAVAGEVQGLKNKISETEQQINKLEGTPEPAAALSDQQYQQILGNLQNLLKQTEAIYQKTSKNMSVTAVAPAAIIPTPAAPVTEKLPVLTSTPNVINGIVTDPAGNFLEGVIIIIHNKDGIPVRALKSNKLGQFTGATPLPDGTYNLTLEKDNWVFNTLQMNLAGVVMPAVKISPKGVARG